MNILSDVREFLTILSIYHSSFIIQKCFNWAYPTVSEYTLVVIEENLIDVSFNYDLEQKKKTCELLVKNFASFEGLTRSKSCQMERKRELLQKLELKS